MRGNKSEKTYKEIVQYMLGNVSVAILGFVISLLYSEMFDPASYGIYSQVAGIYGLVVQIYGGWMVSSIQRHAQQYFMRHQKEQFFGSFVIVQIFMGIAFILAGNGILLAVSLPPLYRTLIFIYTFVYMFEEMMLIFCAFLQVEGNSARYSTSIVLNNLLKIGFLLFLYYILDYRSVAAIVVSLLLTEIIQCVWIGKTNGYWRYVRKKNLDMPMMKRMARYGIPLMGVAVTSWVLSISDRYIIRFYYSDIEVGIHSYAYGLAGSLFQALTQGIILSAYPRIVEKWESGGEEDAREEIGKYWRLFLLILAPCCVGACCVAKDFFHTLVAEEYYEGYVIFSVTAFAMLIMGFSHFTNKVWELCRDTKKILLLNIIAAVFNVVTNFIFIPLYGYYAASCTTLVSYFVYFVVSIVWSRKIFPLDWKWKSVIRIAFCTIVMGIATLALDMFTLVPGVRLAAKILLGVLVYSFLIIATGEFSICEIRKMLKRG